MKRNIPDETSDKFPFQFNSFPVAPSEPPKKFVSKSSLKGSILRIPVVAKVVWPLPGPAVCPSKAIQSDSRVKALLPLSRRILESSSPRMSLSLDSRIIPPELVVKFAESDMSPPITEIGPVVVNSVSILTGVVELVLFRIKPPNLV